MINAALKKRKQARNTRRGAVPDELSNSDHKSGKETEHLSNTDNESNRVERGSSTSDHCVKNTEKTPTEVDVDKSEVTTGYSTTPEHEFVISSVIEDVLVDRNTNIDKVTDGGIASHSGHESSAADGKGSLRGTP
ncbi:hypothetical protein OS493_030147 [Desmophyllum pertusum]|uniref:Uncharacterized protein n=1 Tax=Desmophyllum pertusum TaxID=174260 RepID=A0A9W9YWE6_9CNID|nr:hypothetical protein OS493_030147 [Desmophyllum pertusum]